MKQHACDYRTDYTRGGGICTIDILTSSLIDVDDHTRSIDVTLETGFVWFYLYSGRDLDMLTARLFLVFYKIFFEC